MLAEQDAQTLPDPCDPPGVLGRRATAEDRALAQTVHDKMQKLWVCVCISLMTQAQGSTTACLAEHRTLALNLASRKAEPLPPHQHVYAWAGHTHTHTLTGTQPTTPAFQSHVVLPRDGPKPSLCLFFLEDGKS